MTDFKIPDMPDTDTVWDAQKHRWVKREYDTRYRWFSMENGAECSWEGLLLNFGPLSDTPPVPQVGDILAEETAFMLPRGSVVMADGLEALNMGYSSFMRRGYIYHSWSALQGYVEGKPLRVVRVGWDS